MTVNVDDTKEVLVGDGVTLTWPFDFKVGIPEDLRVFTTSYDGLDSPLVYEIEYSVTLNVNQNTNPGGTITTVLPIPERVPFVIMRGMDFTQLVQFETSVPPHIIEEELDRLTMYTQQLKEKLDRCLHVSAATQNVADMNLRNVHTRRLKFIGFDDAGDAALLTMVGGAVVGPAGVSRVSRVETNAPAVFRQESNGEWSHVAATVTFYWVSNGVLELSRSISVSIDQVAGTFNTPTPVAGITVSIDPSGRLMKLVSSFNNVEDFIQLAIIRMADPVFDDDDFSPTWGGFSSAPAGDVHYTNLNGVVTLTVATAQVGASNNALTFWTAGSMPVAIRPSGSRSVLCKLRYNDTYLCQGAMIVNPDGSATFLPQVVVGDIHQFGVWPAAGEDKGLPEDWQVIYPL